MSTIEQQGLGNLVAQTMREQILNGDLQPGDRLVEVDLAAQFGTSRGPVRDAISELERSGLLEVLPRRGSFVRQLSAADVEEIYSLRMALEDLALRHLLTEHTPTANSDLPAQLRGALSVLHIAHKSGERSAIATADMTLHRAIVAAAGHQRLLQAWDQLADQTMFLMGVLSSVDRLVQHPDGEHLAVVEAILDGNLPAAQASLQTHLRVARDTMVRHWRESDLDESQ